MKLREGLKFVLKCCVSILPKVLPCCRNLHLAAKRARGPCEEHRVAMIEGQDPKSSRTFAISRRANWLDSDGSRPDLRLSTTRKQRNGCIRTGEINDVQPMTSSSCASMHSHTRLSANASRYLPSARPTA
jgi:hypothetical protein